MRMLGHGLGALPVAVVLYENGDAPIYWPLLFMTGYVWPHIARVLTLRARDRKRTELFNLLCDSAIGGAWLAVMAFNLLPSALLLMVLSIDKIGIGGWRLLARSTAVQAISALLVSAALGFPVKLPTQLPETIASLPLLLAYPIVLSNLLYVLGLRVKRQNHQLQQLNRIDELTGLFNRRHFEGELTHEIARHLRSRRPAVLLLLDVDNFKAVNDQHGHAMGDQVLRVIAGVLRDCVRDIDTAARHGGDEFAVLLTEIDGAGATQVAERIRTGFIVARGAQAEDSNCTLSIGLSSIDRTVVTVDEWLQRADAAMYRAKAAGRDQVVSC